MKIIVLVLAGIISAGCSSGGFGENAAITEKEVLSDSEDKKIGRQRLLLSKMLISVDGNQFEPLSELLNSSRYVEIDLSDSVIVKLDDVKLDGETPVAELMNTYPIEFECQLRYLAGNSLGGSLIARGGIRKNRLVIIQFIISSSKVKRMVIFA